MEMAQRAMEENIKCVCVFDKMCCLTSYCLPQYPEHLLSSVLLEQQKVRTYCILDVSVCFSVTTDKSLHAIV